MGAVVAAEPTGYTRNLLANFGERVSTLEGTIENQNRIFDMLHEGQKNLMAYVAELRSETNERISAMDGRINETNERISAMDVRINERINETNERIAAMELTVNKHIAAMDSQLNSKIDSNLKWILGVQIAMWVTIIVAVLL